MKKNKRLRMYCGSIIISLLISSSCILAVPYVYNRQTLTLICSIIFWLTMITGYGIMISLNIFCRKNGSDRIYKRAGIISFFKNKPAVTADAAMISGILFLILSLKAEIMQGYLQYILIFIICFCLHMHCFLNGKNFRFILDEIRREKQ